MQIPYEIKPRPDTGLWNAKIGIWLFLASEVMLFGGLFSGYVFLRLGSQGEADYFWPHGELNVMFGFVNTLILILSSVFVVVSWLQLKLRDYKKFQVYMGLTVVCALVFLVNKGFEYNAKFHHIGVKLSDNSIVHGHGADDTVKYEGITEVGVDARIYNGGFLGTVVGDAPKFSIKADGLPTDDDGNLLPGVAEATKESIDLSPRAVADLVRVANKAKRKHYEEVVVPKLEAENAEIRETNKTLPEAEQIEEKLVSRWLPAMGVRSLGFVASAPFAISTNRSSLRQALSEEAKFADRTSLKGTVSAETPGLKLDYIDTIDLRASDIEDVEDSMVWNVITNHGAADAKKEFMEHRSHAIEKAAEKNKEPAYDDLHKSHVTHKGDDKTSVVIPWEDVRLYSTFTPKWNTYYAIYFLLTGLHGLHVLLGAVVLFYFGFMSKWLYDKDPEHLANRVEVGGLFWHFVDLVWIFLFPILYLM